MTTKKSGLLAAMVAAAGLLLSTNAHAAIRIIGGTEQAISPLNDFNFFFAPGAQQAGEDLDGFDRLISGGDLEFLSNLFVPVNVLGGDRAMTQFDILQANPGPSAFTSEAGAPVLLNTPVSFATLTVSAGQTASGLQFTFISPTGASFTVANENIGVLYRSVDDQDPGAGVVVNRVLLAFDDPADAIEDYDDLLIDVRQTAIPEPSTWAMMLIGFGLVGVALRRQAKAAAAIA